MIADGRSIPPEDDRSNYLEQVMLKRSHQKPNEVFEFTELFCKISF